MNCWFKMFEDHTMIQGSDEEVRNKMVSWCRGPLDKMNGAAVMHGDAYITILGKGEYFQSDTIEVVFPDNQENVIKRRVEKQINSDDKMYSIGYVPEKFFIVRFGEVESNQIFNINSEDIGKWLILEIDTRTLKMKHYLSDNKV